MKNIILVTLLLLGFGPSYAQTINMRTMEILGDTRESQREDQERQLEQQRLQQHRQLEQQRIQQERQLVLREQQRIEQERQLEQQRQQQVIEMERLAEQQRQESHQRQVEEARRVYQLNVIYNLKIQREARERKEAELKIQITKIKYEQSLLDLHEGELDLVYQKAVDQRNDIIELIETIVQVKKDMKKEMKYVKRDEALYIGIVAQLGVAISNLTFDLLKHNPIIDNIPATKAAIEAIDYSKTALIAMAKDGQLNSSIAFDALELKTKQDLAAGSNDILQLTMTFYNFGVELKETSELQMSHREMKKSVNEQLRIIESKLNKLKKVMKNKNLIIQQNRATKDAINEYIKLHNIKRIKTKPEITLG